jgi:hypothetical protein
MKKLNEKLRERRWAAEDAADRELEWFFACANGTVPEQREGTPAVRKAAATIQGWLGALTTFHVGAVSLRYTPRDWPKGIKDEFGDWTSLVVRLECAAYSSDGRTSTSELEEAAVRRLELLVARRGERRELDRLVRRARRHVHQAIRAYVKVRGFGVSVLPRGRRVA